MARTKINPQSVGSVKFAASDAGLAAGTEIGCQVMKFLVKPKPNVIQVQATLCAAASEEAGMSTYEVDMEYLQDWGVATSVSKYFFDNEGATIWFEYFPTAAVDGMKGSCTCPGASYGGEADKNWVESVTLLCTAKPTRVAHA